MAALSCQESRIRCRLVVFRLPVKEPAVFLTVDDGWSDPTVLGLI